MAVAPIVEGHAEEQSVPVLLRRLGIPVVRPFRVKRNRIVKPGEFERTVQAVLRVHPQTTALMLLLDADDDCPAEVAPMLVERSRSVTHLPVSVVFAVRELEAWFLGGIESLRGRRHVRSDASWPGDPEAPRGAKERLGALMQDRAYVDVEDQPALMALLDIEAARRRCPSLDKLLRDLAALGFLPK